MFCENVFLGVMHYHNTYPRKELSALPLYKKKPAFFWKNSQKNEYYYLIEMFNGHVEVRSLYFI